jgi:hypothetical protein
MTVHNLPLNPSVSEWKDSHGNLIQLCVIHELMPDLKEHIRSITTFGGYALCRECLNNVKRSIEIKMTLNDTNRSIDDIMTSLIIWSVPYPEGN